jgi:hypothetical protein
MPHKAAHSNLAEQQQHSGMQASPLQPPAAQQTAVAGALVGTTSFTTTQPANAVSAQQQQQQQQQQRQRPDPRSLFHKGVAISVWQNSSDEASNWTAFMRRKRFFGQGQLLQAFMESNDFWNRWDEGWYGAARSHMSLAHCLPVLMCMYCQCVEVTNLYNM